MLFIIHYLLYGYGSKSGVVGLLCIGVRVLCTHLQVLYAVVHSSAGVVRGSALIRRCCTW